VDRTPGGVGRIAHHLGQGLVLVGHQAVGDPPVTALDLPVAVAVALPRGPEDQNDNPMVLHIVLFNTRPGTDIRSFARQIQADMRLIPKVQRALIGSAVRVAPEYSRSMGDTTYEYAAVVEFLSENDLEAYLNHPVHRELGRLFWEHAGSTVVMEARVVDVLTEDLTSMIPER
jgi:hypothetical protein